MGTTERPSIRMTYRDIVRTYSDNVDKGYADTDLTPRERRLVRTMLNIASNAGMASVHYPPTDYTRDDVCQYLGNVLWESRALVQAVSPASADAFESAAERAIAIIRNV